MKFVETLPLDEISRFCRRWQICELALFGSAIRDDFHAGSDIDILVTYDRASNWGLFDHAQMKNELEKLFGRKIDLVTRRALEQTQNSLLRTRILNTAQVIFSEGETSDAQRWYSPPGHHQRGAAGERIHSGIWQRQIYLRQENALSSLYQITVIGEAVKRLSKEFRADHAQIPWTLIAGMRDSVIHGYDLVDWDEVWKTSTVDIPDLLEKISSYQQ